METDSDVVHAFAQAQRAVAWQQRERLRAERRAEGDATGTQRAYERALREQRAAETKRAAREEKLARAEAARRAELYREAREAQVALENEHIDGQIERLQQLLADALSSPKAVDFSSLKRSPVLPTLDLASVPVDRALQWDDYRPRKPGILHRLVPGSMERYAEETARAQERFDSDVAEQDGRMAAFQAEYRAKRAAYDHQVATMRTQMEAQHAAIDAFAAEYTTGVPDAVIAYCMLVLEASAYPQGCPQRARVAYIAESHQMVVEYEMPTAEIVPETARFKYAKAQDAIVAVARPQAQRKALYASVIAQITLRTLHELFNADTEGHLQTIVFNGLVETIDPAVGKPIRPCVVTVRATRDVFTSADLTRVNPTACLRMLNASVSKSPSELAPVRPVLEFDMVDPRFINGSDVLSALDQRPNLMDLTPSEFEALIANLFQRMGLETRLTQASRDGGVDCVAYDPRPILGGKVVIQAKRYKHTVGVSAVRDLFGTVQNEGASKGILVTTSGYGRAAFDFARGKPLELLSGSNLLALLADHAGIEARIVVPDQWQDPSPDLSDA